MPKRIIAILNQKGGVGKTTTTINLAAFMARSGKKVLVCDIDPQGNTTSGLGLDKQTLDSTIYDVMFGNIEASAAIVEVSGQGIFLLPTNADLAGAEVELVGAQSREFKLKKVLAPLEYDYIFIDCPPSLGLLSINALVASTDILIPVQAEYYALEGLSQLMATLQQVKAGLNPNLNVLGVVMTMFDKRTSLAEQVVAEVRKHFGNKVFETVIPRNVKLAEAPSFGKPVVEHDRWSKGSRAYKALAKELERRL